MMGLLREKKNLDIINESIMISCLNAFKDYI